MSQGRVVLGPAEILHGAMIGVIRETNAIANALEHSHDLYDITNDWQQHVEGALAEMAFAKFIGKYWTGAYEFGGVDVPPDWEVRVTVGANHRLIIHPSDRDGKRFVLLTGINGTYNVRGWTWGEAGKNKTYWDEPVPGRPAYFVPQHRLETRF